MSNNKENEPQPKCPPCFVGTMQYMGKSYTSQTKSFRKTDNVWVHRMRCWKHRDGCMAYLIHQVNSNGESTIATSDVVKFGQSLYEHTACIGSFNKKNSSVKAIEIDGITDYTGEMRQMVEQKAVDEPGKRASQMARDILSYFQQKTMGTACKLLDTKQIQAQIYRVRDKEFGNWEGILNSFPMNAVSEQDDRPFLQWNNWANIGGTHQKSIGLGHPDIQFELSHSDRNHLFLDATFAVCPRGFSQLFIVMAYLSAYDLYVPVYFILMQTKDKATYEYVLNMAIQHADYKLLASSVTTDFELGMMDAAKFHFSEPCQLIGCFFHFKQCARRKLIELLVPKYLISEFMGPNGLFELVTVVPINEIIRKCIPYIRSHFPEGEYKSNFDAFWRYFLSTMMNRYDPNDWNIERFIGSNDPDVLIQRTNNPLERFNRRLNEAFSEGKPSMIEFVETIKQICQEYIEEMEAIKRNRGRNVRARREPVHIMTVPEDYASFDPDTYSG